MVPTSSHGRPDDRRKFARHKAERLVKFVKDDGSECRSISRILNVSHGGLQFASHDPIRPSSLIRMDIDGTHDMRPISLKGRVMWSNPSPDANGLYYTGIAFVDLREDLRPIILTTLVPNFALETE